MTMMVSRSASWCTACSICRCCRLVQHLSKVQTAPLTCSHFEGGRHTPRMLTRQQQEAAICLWVFRRPIAQRAAMTSLGLVSGSHEALDA